MEEFVRTIAYPDKLLTAAEHELKELDVRREAVARDIQRLKTARDSVASLISNKSAQIGREVVTKDSAPEDKIALFRRLFRGREDVYPRRFESTKTGKSGYQPACQNEWIRPFCKKPKIKCGECPKREFRPVTDDVIRNHLQGTELDSKSKKDFTIGVYPLLPDETCCFLAADFDKRAWMEDLSAVRGTCRTLNVPAVVERSRSGNGAHLWIFFSPSALPLPPSHGYYSIEYVPLVSSYRRFLPNSQTFIRFASG